MPAPVFVTVTKMTAVKIATAVTSGQVHKVKPGSAGAQYFATYVPTGAAPPAAEADFRGGRVFIDSDTEMIESGSAEQIDVYLWLTGDKDGEVRVDA
jgi:hypothetical protein